MQYDVLMEEKRKEKNDPNEKKPKRDVSVVSDSIDNELNKNKSMFHNLTLLYVNVWETALPHLGLDYNPPLSLPIWILSN